MLRTLRVTVDGHEYQVTVEDLTDTGNQLYPQPGSMSMPMAPPPQQPPGPPPAQQPPPAPLASGAGAVSSPMSGVLVELLVAVGQPVAPGDTVAVIEAMKMKTPVAVQQGGTVASIDVAVNDAVQVGQTLLTIS